MDNKYTHADIQVRPCGGDAAHRDSLCSCRRGAEVSGVQHQETVRGQRGGRSGGPARPGGGSWTREESFQTHDPGSDEEPQELNQRVLVRFKGNDAVTRRTVEMLRGELLALADPRR